MNTTLSPVTICHHAKLWHCYWLYSSSPCSPIPPSSTPLATTGLFFVSMILFLFFSIWIFLIPHISKLEVFDWIDGASFYSCRVPFLHFHVFPLTITFLHLIFQFNFLLKIIQTFILTIFYIFPVVLTQIFEMIIQ